MVPPPPPIGGVRRAAKKATPKTSTPEAAKSETEGDPKATRDAAPEKTETSSAKPSSPPVADEANPFEDNATARWPNVDAPIASDDGPSDTSIPDIEPTESSPGAPRPPVLTSRVRTGSSPLPAPPPFTSEPDAPSNTKLVTGLDGSDETPSGRITAPTRSATPVGEAEASTSAKEEQPAPAPAPPKLPMPSMLRDGKEAPAADFRAKPRPRASAKAAAMPPPRGMVPPKLGAEQDEGERKLNPGDTASFVAAVAVELMQEASAEEEAVSPAAASMAGAKARAESETEKAAVVVPPATAAANDDGPRKGALWIGGAIAAVLVFGGIWWMTSGDDEPPTGTSNTVAAAEPEPEPKPPVAEPEPEPIPAAAGSTGGTGGTEDTGAGSTGTGDDGSGTQGSDGSSDSGTGGSGTNDTGGSDTGSDTEGATETGDEIIEDEPVAAASSRPRSRRPKPKPPADSTSKPTPPKPKPKPKPETKPLSPSDLLAKARTAYKSGKGAAAYGFASKSYRQGKSNAAAELMTLAACQMKNPAKAKAALRNVPLLSRNRVRSTCKSKHGVKIGL